MVDRRLPEAKYENREGYITARDVSMDEMVEPMPHPYTVLMSTYDPGYEAQFTLTIWYKKEAGCEVTIVEA